MELPELAALYNLAQLQVKRRGSCVEPYRSGRFSGFSGGPTRAACTRADFLAELLTLFGRHPFPAFVGIPR